MVFRLVRMAILTFTYLKVVCKENLREVYLPVSSFYYKVRFKYHISQKRIVSQIRIEIYSIS